MNINFKSIEFEHPLEKLIISLEYRFLELISNNKEIIDYPYKTKIQLDQIERKIKLEY